MSEALARKFHEAYERLAPQFGYVTGEETRRFDPESPNGKLMIAVCSEFFSEEKARAERYAGHLIQIAESVEKDYYADPMNRAGIAADCRGALDGAQPYATERKLLKGLRAATDYAVSLRKLLSMAREHIVDAAGDIIDREDSAILTQFLSDIDAALRCHEIGQRNCPTCDGDNPAHHPAVQEGGEVHLCEDAWHKPTAAEIRAKEQMGHAVGRFQRIDEAAGLELVTLLIDASLALSRVQPSNMLVGTLQRAATKLREARKTDEWHAAQGCPSQVHHQVCDGTYPGCPKCREIAARG